MSKDANGRPGTVIAFTGEKLSSFGRAVAGEACARSSTAPRAAIVDMTEASDLQLLGIFLLRWLKSYCARSCHCPKPSSRIVYCADISGQAKSFSTVPRGKGLNANGGWEQVRPKCRL